MSNYHSLWDVPVTDIKGKSYATLGAMIGSKKPKLTIVANVASRCGLTKKHYTQFNDLYDKF